MARKKKIVEDQHDLDEHDHEVEDMVTHGGDGDDDEDDFDIEDLSDEDLEDLDLDDLDLDDADLEDEDFDVEDDDTVEEDEDFDEDELSEDQASSNAASVSTSKSKIHSIAQAVTLLNSMKHDEINKLCDSLMTQAGAAAAKTIPDGTAEKNKASIAMKEAVAEDLSKVFGDNAELSEEFKENVTTLFEAAVDLRVSLIRTELDEEYANKLNEEVAEITEGLIVKVDEYLNYVAEEWMKNNEVAVVSNLRADIAEQLVADLHAVFVENHIAIPEDKVDVVEQLAAENEALEAKLDEVLEHNMTLTSQVTEFERQVMVAEMTEGLAMTQADKFVKLTEGIEYDGDTDAFRKKLGIVKGKYFTEGKKQSSTGIITEEITYNEGEEHDPAAAVVVKDPAMKMYMHQISRTTPYKQ